MPALTFGGLDLTRYCYVQVERPVAARLAVEAATAAGRDGDVPTSASLEPLEVTAHCVLKRRYRADWPTLRAAIAEALSSREPQALTLPDEGGLRRMATASLQGSLTMPARDIEFDVAFCDHDCRAYLEPATVDVPSGGSATFTLAHPRPDLSIHAQSAVRNPGTALWGLRFDDGDYVRVRLPTPSATAIAIDCAARSVSVAGATSMVTLDSDWPELAAGTHAVRMDQGTGVAALTITERCL